MQSVDQFPHAEEALRRIMEDLLKVIGDAIRTNPDSFPPEIKAAMAAALPGTFFL